MERLGGGEAVRGTDCGEPVTDSCAEGLQFAGIHRVHRRLVLALVCLECIELAVERTTHVLDVVDDVGLPEQEVGRAVVGAAQTGEEVRIARGYDRIADEQTCRTVIGVEPIPLPRVVTQHHIGSELAYGTHDLTADRNDRFEFAVDHPEESHLAGTVAGQPTSRLTLFTIW